MKLDAYLATAQQGDFVVYQGSAWISQRIAAATGSPCTHVAMVVGDEFVVEAAWPRVRVCHIRDTLSDVQRIEIRRPNQQSPLQAARRVLWALTRTGWRYDAASLSWWILPDWLRGRKNWLSSARPICSELLAWACRKNGEDFWNSRPTDTIVPGDFPASPQLGYICAWPISAEDARHD